jgi:hypothetical protein
MTGERLMGEIAALTGPITGEKDKAIVFFFFLLLA